MVQKIFKICQRTWDFRGGSSLCSDECRTEWTDVLRPRAYERILKPHRAYLSKVHRDVDAGMATQEQKHAATENLKRARALYGEFLDSLNPHRFLEDLI